MTILITHDSGRVEVLFESTANVDVCGRMRTLTLNNGRVINLQTVVKIEILVTP